MIHKNNQDSCAAKIVISSPDLSETARFIRNLSDLKQIFLHMGSVEEEYYEPGVDDIKESQSVTWLPTSFFIR